MRQLHGYTKLSNYKEFFYLILISWIIVEISAFVSKIAIPKVILIISIIGLVTEFIASFLMLSYTKEKNN
ncbi:DUF1430 domain-containing protein [Clostridium tepidum]|uniref:DUF1430 domain-containing protein n=1 Tax=Clostridium tepidum TaxID=1962263 RepID=UPI001F3C376A|nr:DUF1430 domain-containing protein [Clostridium tepidum]MCR1934316.1 DUF1430 domain-containing protein [Clostridium tepidum]